MNYHIDSLHTSEYPEVVEVWEASVRATHHFLQEKDITLFKPLILKKYLDAVALSCIRDDERRILGFMGVADRKIEMLFIHPRARGKGIGKVLVTHAIDTLGVNQVDVNEDNEQAVGFYQHLGFKTVARSELDSSGNPYPILHMKLAS